MFSCVPIFFIAHVDPYRVVHWGAFFVASEIRFFWMTYYSNHIILVYSSLRQEPHNSKAWGTFAGVCVTYTVRPRTCFPTVGPGPSVVAGGHPWTQALQKTSILLGADCSGVRRAPWYDNAACTCFLSLQGLYCEGYRLWSSEIQRRLDLVGEEGVYPVYVCAQSTGTGVAWHLLP